MIFWYYEFEFYVFPDFVKKLPRRTKIQVKIFWFWEGLAMQSLYAFSTVFQCPIIEALWSMIDYNWRIAIKDLILSFILAFLAKKRTTSGAKCKQEEKNALIFSLHQSAEDRSLRSLLFRQKCETESSIFVQVNYSK